MAKLFAKWFYNSKAWIDCRASFIADRVSIDGGMCQACREEFGYIVDHVTELTPENIHDPEVALNHSNFRYLCLKCHNKKTFGYVDEQRYYFDSEGQIHGIKPQGSI